MFWGRKEHRLLAHHKALPHEQRSRGPVPSTIMVRVNDKIITDPAHISQHMNDFFVNIASKIEGGGDIDVNQTSECNIDLVTKCVNHFSDHQNVTGITNTMKTAYFSFRHTTPTEVENIMQSLNMKKPRARTGYPPNWSNQPQDY